MTAPEVYGAGPTRRRRRTKAEIQAIKNAIYDVAATDHPMTLRGVFYRLVSQGVVAKTEAEYDSTVGRLLLELRRDGTVPYQWIADGTRLMRKPSTWEDLEDVLYYTAQHYRRAVWDHQPAYVEVWSEKEAIAGILHQVTAEWDVPLMIARGFSSETFLWSAAQEIKRIAKPTFLYHFGDHDPSGVAAANAIERRLHEFAPDAEITFVRVAVTLDQIEEWNLPTRPTKRTDSRAKNWVGGSVEVDAIPPRLLRGLVEECVTRHVDRAEHDLLLEIEAQEREDLIRLTEEYVP